MTDAERMEIIRARTAEGWSCAKIAPYAECSMAKVNILQRQFGIVRAATVNSKCPSRDRLRLMMNSPVEEVAKTYGVTETTVFAWFRSNDFALIGAGRNKGRRIDLQEVRELASKGWHCAQIAEAIGGTPKQIWRLAKKNVIELSHQDRNEASRKRPPKAEFSQAYKDHTLRDVAEIYGVTEGAASKWALHYGLRAMGPSRIKRSGNRPIAGSCSPRAINRALAQLERRV